jgi:hypothetical protein
MRDQIERFALKLKNKSSGLKIRRNVLIGTNNWLYLHQGHQKQFDYLSGELKVERKSVENFVSNIRNRTAFFEEQSIPYRHIVFPSKPLVQKQYLPGPYCNIRSLFDTYYRPELGRWEENVVYPLDTLSQLEKSASTFLKYNTHNSDLGYFSVCNQLIGALGFTPFDEQTYFDRKEIAVGGDLTAMLNSQDTNIETFLVPKQGIDFGYAFGNRRYIPGNTNDVLIFHNQSALTSRRVLVFGDSFFKGLLRYFRLLFTDVVYMRSTFIHRDIVDCYQPDVVFTGNAERYLASVESDDTANHFLLSLYGNPNYKPDAIYLDALRAMLSFRHYPHIYNDWAKKIEKGAHANPIRVSPPYDKADILREVALYFENRGDIDTAHAVMSEALSLRPNVPFLNQKCNEYVQEKLSWKKIK